MQNQRNTNRSKLSSSLEIRVISASCSSWAFWRSLARALESSNSCMFGSFTRLGHVGSFQRPLPTCMILVDIVWSCIYNESTKQCEFGIDVGIAYHFWILAKSAIQRPWTNVAMTVFTCETGTTWLSLASWDISASNFSSRTRIRVIPSLHSSRSCTSQEKHQQSRKNRPVSFWHLILSGLRCLSLSRSSEK